MKTRPVKPNPKKHTVNFISNSELLTEKVGSFYSQSRTIAMLVSESPLPEENLDAYVVPARGLPDLFTNDRRPDTWLPVIAYGDRSALAEAFAFGCRDFLKEPWDVGELDIRLAAVLNAVEGNGEVVLSGNRVKTADGEVLLQPNEARILRALLKARGGVVSREVLYYAIWGKIKNPESRVVDVHVSALRRKLSGVSGLAITQVRGEGYQLS